MTGRSGQLAVPGVPATCRDPPLTMTRLAVDRVRVADRLLVRSDRCASQSRDTSRPSGDRVCSSESVVALVRSPCAPVSSPCASVSSFVLAPTTGARGRAPAKVLSTATLQSAPLNQSSGPLRQAFSQAHRFQPTWVRRLSAAARCPAASLRALPAIVLTDPTLLRGVTEGNCYQPRCQDCARSGALLQV